MTNLEGLTNELITLKRLIQKILDNSQYHE